MIKIDGGTYAAAGASPQTFIGLATGDHTVWVKDANNCEKSATINVGTPTVVTLSLEKTDVVCNGESNGTVTATFGGGVGPYMIKIDGGTYAAAGASPQTFTGLATGDHTVWVKDANNCEKSATINVGTPTVVTLSLEKTDVSCYGTSNGTVKATFGGGIAPYMIKIDGGTYAAAGTSPQTFTGLAAGDHTVWVKDANNCEKSATINVGTPDPLTLELTPGVEICVGTTEGTISADVTGTPLEDLEIDIDGEGFNPVTASPVEFTGLTGGSHTVTLRRISDNNCLVEETAMVTEIPCGGEVCTYTQGYYGNDGGMSCDGENQQTTAGLIQQSVGSGWNGTLTIGLPGYSINITTADAAKVIEYLPGGSGISALSAGDVNIADTNFKLWYVGKKGTINNKLLAQTITLGLNLGLNTPLGDVELDGYIVTAERDGGCGSDVAKIRNCYSIWDDVNEVYVWVVENDYMYSMIDASVVALTDGTVQGLYDLANTALGTPGLYDNAMLTKIAGAVDKINNVFDNCRIYIGTWEEQLTCGPQLQSAQIINPSLAASDLKVYPNPFSDKLNFEFVSGVNARAVLEIYNITGQSVTRLLDRNVEEGVMNRVEYSPANINSGVYIYKLTIDGNTSVGRVIYKK
jgi:hypothetical protein